MVNYSYYWNFLSVKAFSIDMYIFMKVIVQLTSIQRLPLLQVKLQKYRIQYFPPQVETYKQTQYVEFI